MPQFTLPLALPASFSADRFTVSDCNRAAYEWVMRWPDWPSHALIISGLAGSGKTHLSHIWAARSGAAIVPAHALNPEAIATHVVIEQIEQADARALFHSFNICKEKNLSLLMTSAYEPPALPFTLPDLTSRLRAAPHARLGAPDDALLIAALRKQFSDRQLMVDDEVLSYLAARMERSLTSAMEAVETIDQTALAERKNITIPFVRQTLRY